MAPVTEVPRFAGGRVLAIAGLVGLAGLVATAIGIAIDPGRALLGYLAAYAAVAAIAIGALVLLLIGYATNARWLAPLRRLQEAIAGVFPALAVLFVPIALGLDRIYVWADPPADLPEHERALIAAKQAWLDPAGFVVRTAVYLAVFLVAAELLRRWSRRRDGALPAGDPEDAMRRERVFAAAMLPPVGLALTFASIDWLMSLQPTWLSTMFGVYFFAAGFSAAIAVLAIVAAGTRAPIGLSGNHFHALGRMLLGFVVFWAYASYFQGFLIQIANRPSEVTFYLARTRDGWQLVLWAVVIARFALPFFLLLPRAWKHRPGYVAAVGGIVLVGHALDMLWLVVPSAGSSQSASWIDLAALVGIAGACTAFAAWRQRGVPVVAAGDPLLAAGHRYESPT
jgi:hypothetical protein